MLCRPEQRLAIEDRPLQEKCVYSDGPQFIKQLPPCCGRPSELRIRQLEKSTFKSLARSFCLWVRAQKYRSDDQDRPDPPDPRYHPWSLHLEPRNDGDGKDHTRRRQRIVDGVPEARQKLYRIPRSVVLVFVEEAT